MRFVTKMLALLLIAALLGGCTPSAQSPTPSEPPTASEAPAPEVPSAQPSPTPPAVTPIPPEEVLELHFTKEELPVFNGSTSTQPLAHAVASVLVGETRDSVATWMHFSRTTESYRRLMSGHADILIAAEPADTVVEEERKSAFSWEMAPIATDALVFLVNENNPVDNLTIEQVQKIYTGEITNWSEVGGEDREIIPFQRNAEAGSQTLMKKLVMGELELMEPPVEYMIGSMSGLIEAVRSFDGSPGAIGYTVYYYANDMNMAEGLKVVSVGGAKPDAATIRSGKYPFTNPYYAVIDETEPEDSPARQIFEWLQGPVGQSLIQHEGYVSILENPAFVEWDLGETMPVAERYTRLSPEPMTELVASPKYGGLLPYVGGSLDGPDYFGSLDKYGLVTREGMIVTDPVYDSVYTLSYYDPEAEYSRFLNCMALTRTMDTGDGMETVYALAAQDGSWVTEFQWLWVSAVDDEHIWAVELDGSGVMLDQNLKELWRIELPEKAEKWLYQGGMNGGMWWNDGVGQVYIGELGSVDINGNWLSSEKDGCVNIQPAGEGLYSAQRADRELWGYIDGQGNWVIEPTYTVVNSFFGGKAVVIAPDGKYLVIDPKGNVLLESGDALERRTSDQGDWYAAYKKVKVNGEIRDEITAAYDADLRSLDWKMIGKTVETEQKHWWFVSEAGIELSTPYESRTFDLSADARLRTHRKELLIFDRTEEGKELWSAWNMSGECLLAEEELNYLSILADRVTGEAYLYAQHPDGESKLYDGTGKHIMDCVNWPDISYGLVEVRSDLSYGYKSTEDEWVFRISLMKSRGD